MTARAMTQDDLRWLACPVCHQPLVLIETPAAIRCTGCARVYPFAEGLPVLLASRAITL